MVYSNTKREIIGILNSWVIWSVLLVNGLALAMLLIPAISGGGLRQVFVALELFLLAAYLFWLYRLSIALNPSRYEAWSNLLVQFVPFVGMIFTILLIAKAWRISKDIVLAEATAVPLPLAK